MIKTNKTVLITGSAQRLGKAIGLELHYRGLNIAIHCNQSVIAAKQLSKQFNSIRPQSSCVIQQDISQTNAEKYIIEQVITSFGTLNYLVNNAAIFYPTPIADNLAEVAEGILTDENSEQNLLMVNFIKPQRLSLAAMPYLKNSRGAIVNIIDIYAQTGLSEHCHYVASKAALEQASRNLAMQFAPEVRINNVSPGAILWPEDESQSSQAQQSIINNSALKSIGKPQDIAKTVSYLLLDALYTTGASINVDGGRQLYL